MDQPKAIIAIGVHGDGEAESSDNDMPQGVEVPMPDGFSFHKPEEEKDGGMYMCKLKMGPEGKLVLMEIDGLPVGEPDSSDDDSDEPLPDADKGDGAIGLLGRLMGKARRS